MRCAGLVSDYLGEPRVEELQVTTAFGPGTLHVSWQGGQTVMGGPLGMPIGKDKGISFQLYVNTQFQGASWDVARKAPVGEGGLNWVEIIPVATHLRDTDQYHVCTTTNGERARLTWPASASSDIDRYNIYSNSGSGAVSYTATYATVAAKPGGVAPSTYTYESPRLASGTWVFGIRGVDEAGNIQTTPKREDSCTVQRVPEPPSGLGYTYAAGTQKITLSWTAPTNWT